MKKLIVSLLIGVAAISILNVYLKKKTQENFFDEIEGFLDL